MSQENAPSNTFFIIEIVNALGRRGFAMEMPDGIKFCIGGYDINTRQFDTRDEALNFVTKNRLGKLGKIRILSNHDIMKQYGKAVKGKMLVITNEKEEFLHFDTEQNGYYFNNRFAGCCFWDKEKDVNDFVEVYQPHFDPVKLIVKPIGNKI